MTLVASNGVGDSGVLCEVRTVSRLLLFFFLQSRGQRTKKIKPFKSSFWNSTSAFGGQNPLGVLVHVVTWNAARKRSPRRRASPATDHFAYRMIYEYGLFFRILYPREWIRKGKTKNQKRRRQHVFSDKKKLGEASVGHSMQWRRDCAYGI